MRKAYSKGMRIFTYLLLFLVACTSFLCLCFVYIKTGAIALPTHETVTSGQVLVNGEKTYAGNEIIIKAGQETWNGLIGKYMPENTKFGHIDGYLYNLERAGSNNLYLNVREPRASLVFSFVCSTSLEFSDAGSKDKNASANSAVVKISDVRLGKYDAFGAGNFLWEIFGLPKSMEIPLNPDDELVYLSSAAAGGNSAVVLTYKYDSENASELISSVLEHADTKKIDLHKEKNDVDPKLIALAEKKTATEEESVELMTSFKENAESFKQLTYLLNKEGITLLCENFGEHYYKFMDAGALAKLSDEEINSDVNAFHRAFGKMVLEYLYSNSDYTVSNGALYHGGKEITADTILSEKGESSNIYNVTLHATDSEITAKYALADYTADRTILGNSEGGD